MIEKKESLPKGRRWLYVVMLGSILGMLEIGLGGLIRQSGLPFRSAAVTGVGLAIMAVGLAVFSRPSIVWGISLTAIFSRWLAVPLVNLPIFCQANSHLAMLLNGLWLFAAILLFRKKMSEAGLASGLIAGGGMLLSTATFYTLGKYVAPCQALLNFHYSGGLLAYLVTKGLPAMIASAILFPAGYGLGEYLAKKKLPLWLEKERVADPTAAAISMLCWTLVVAMTAAGS